MIAQLVRARMDRGMQKAGYMIESRWLVNVSGI